MKQIIHCPACGAEVDRPSGERLDVHLVCFHGVDYRKVSPGIDEHRIGYLSPCGKLFESDEECIEHVLQHGKECVLEHFLRRWD